MTDFAAFRDYQTRSTIVAEKERAVELRRRVLQDLAQNVQLLGDECRRREEQLQAEHHRYAHRRAAQDEKLAAKERQAQLQRERVAALEAEESRLRAALADRLAQQSQLRDDIQAGAALREKLREAAAGVARLKCRREERDGEVAALEAHAARAEELLQRRHTHVEERLPGCWLPRVETARGVGLEDTAGESILLIDEFN
ncbi:uncharacterized protein TM35_000371020 [Trypanosoma theileri]|uniref:Uncharacterized protein n=1 Tax=Trypanosoma theileri TaxID=67003 RepID=A0A1X0NLU8_9TRYP|nr:uncharacterized protein TM35_000371020 [Trypanosoma theileri]ORC85129.1 hypothetical protein TM35_000371020 [Trypanosoma theileri]